MKSTSLDVSVVDELGAFVDCFDREANGLDGWSVPLGVWSISGNGRSTTATTTGAPDGESWMWAGDPARASTEGDMAITFDVPSVLFTGNPADGVRRHFGVMFNSSAVTTNRFGPESGYVVWWIDRESDFGLSLARWDGPALTVLQAGTGELFADPPASWRIETEGAMIRVYGDDQLAIEVEDATYRSGFVGWWAWKNMSFQVDDVKIGPSVDDLPDCPVTGGLQLPGDINQDLQLNISDGVGQLNYLFAGNFGPLPCGDGTLEGEGNIPLLDHNGDAAFNISDPVALLNYLFSGGPAPALGTEPVSLDGCPDA